MCSDYYYLLLPIIFGFYILFDIDYATINSLSFIFLINHNIPMIFYASLAYVFGIKFLLLFLLSIFVYLIYINSDTFWFINYITYLYVRDNYPKIKVIEQLYFDNRITNSYVEYNIEYYLKSINNIIKIICYISGLNYVTSLIHHTCDQIYISISSIYNKILIEMEKEEINIECDDELTKLKDIEKMLKQINDNMLEY